MAWYHEHSEVLPHLTELELAWPKEIDSELELGWLMDDSTVICSDSLKEVELGSMLAAMIYDQGC